MGTTAQKLEYLGTTKSQLKDMINYGLDDNNKITSSTTFRNYVSSIFNAFLEALRNPDTLFTNLPKKSGSGANITLNDTANAPMRIELGSRELEQYSENYITSSTRSGNILYFNGATTSTDYVFKAGTYTISFTNSNNPSVYVRSANTDSTSLGSGSPKTITMTEPFNVWLYRSGMTDNETTNIKLLSNAPSPTTPQDIHTISGSNKVIINGSQLFDKDNADIVTGYIDGTTGELLLGGTSKATREYIPIIPNIDMNISGFNNIVLAFYNKDKTFIERVLTASSSYTFNRNAYYIRIQGTGDTFNADTIMLNKGTSALPYEPYVSQEADIDLGVENILHNTATTTTTNGITFKVMGDGTVIVNGTATSNASLIINSNMVINGTYTISSGLGIDNKYFIRALDRNNGYAIVMRTDQDNATATLNTNIQVLIYVSSGTTCNNVVFKPQIEPGTKTSPYNIYGYEPIQYCKIGNYEDKFIRNSGKNLFDNSITPENYSYNSSGVKISDSDTCINQEINNIDYSSIYVSFSSIVGTAYVRVCEYNSNGTFIKRTLVNTNQALTLDSNTKKLIFSVNASSTKYFTNLMINTGTTALDYEPYGSNEWYKKNKILKKVFDGSEDEGWATTSTNTTNVRRMITTAINSLIKPPSSASVLPNIICNRYIEKTNNQTYALNQGLSVGTSGRIEIYDETYNTTDVSLYTTWLSTHNIELYYVLETPTYTKIEGTLAEQLENVYQKLLSQKGQTNISQVNNDLGFVMSATALEDLA